jgi:quinol monooxygenase YgiN
MELIIATLASIRPGQDIDSLTRIRLVYDTLRNAPGVIASNLYHHRSESPYYLLITTWDDEASWKSADKRHNPQLLLRETMGDLLTSLPRQWYMHYLWGYSRAAQQPYIAMANLLAIPARQLRHANQECLLHLRPLTIQATLTFAFLAYGVTDTDGSSAPPPPDSTHSTEPQTTLFSLFSWSSEEERSNFLQHPQMQSLNTTLRQWGKLETLPLDLL